VSAAPTRATTPSAQPRTLGADRSAAARTLGGDASRGAATAAAPASASPATAPGAGPDSRTALLERAAQQEPPRVIVSIVGSSSRPLSTSDRRTADAAEASSDPRRGNAASGMRGSGSLASTMRSALGGTTAADAP